jgi:hypothetical protein
VGRGLWCLETKGKVSEEGRIVRQGGDGKRAPDIEHLYIFKAEMNFDAWREDNW